MNDPKTSPREEAATTGQATGVLSGLSRNTDKEVLEILVADSPLDSIEIAKIADRHPITVDRTCARLYEQELIYPISRGRYDVTDTGLHRTDNGSDAVVER